jgi:hypothetical protein
MTPTFVQQRHEAALNVLFMQCKSFRVMIEHMMHQSVVRHTMHQHDHNAHKCTVCAISLPEQDYQIKNKVQKVTPGCCPHAHAY